MTPIPATDRDTGSRCLILAFVVVGYEVRGVCTFGKSDREDGGGYLWVISVDRLTIHPNSDFPVAWVEWGPLP